MREYIKQQLAKCAYADLSHYDEATNSYFIPKQHKKYFEVGKTYLLKLDHELVNNKASVIATNWNNGLAPSGDILRAYVSQQMGNMLYVDSIIVDSATMLDTTSFWSGWLPIAQISQISS